MRSFAMLQILALGRASGRLLLGGLLFAIPLGSAFGCESAASPQPAFVLVHGAFLTEQAFGPVADVLESRGHEVVRLNLPGRGPNAADPSSVDLKSAADRVVAAVEAQPGPVIVVAHGLGGAAVTEAAVRVEGRLAALVYLAGIIPLPGESAMDKLLPETRAALDGVATEDAAKGVWRIDPVPAEERIFPDLRGQDAALADATKAALSAEPTRLLGDRLSYVAKDFDWLTKFYIVNTRDRFITPANQKIYLEQTPVSRIFELDADHTPSLSMPTPLADTLEDIDRSVGAR